MSWFIFIIGCLLAFLLLWGAYIEGQLSMMKDNLKACEMYLDSLGELEKRINTMQELIDYNEGVINNALNTDLTPKKALKYIEDCYIIGDEIQYQEMENCDEGDCFCRERDD